MPPVIAKKWFYCLWKVVLEKENVRGLKGTIKKPLRFCKGCITREEDIMIDPSVF